ncbi:protein FAR-RED IMPAIRED RESPONSE 1-like [Olea europaea var. sylvestris]|uniref:protein FAR-RED IMPAIRED RESPONSE 1-like n=1 Tax=Olea europaea var. sylvestris TaxID=158386 RepID=UPI000C1D02E7|nr:protein FAR-RED IMPAIRED RESPONSE 1-like [Olea europaea var. sylvestris]
MERGLREKTGNGVLSATTISSSEENMEEILCTEPENDNVEDNVNVVEGDTEVGHSLTMPEVGMKFKDEKEISMVTGNLTLSTSSTTMRQVLLSRGYIVVEACGYENMTCVEKDCRNYIEQSYFSEMQAKCSRFFFSIDLDDDSRLKNVFWGDNRYRQTYKEFGDVVTFDTTYLTNKYDMPFAPFVGVNHHGQSTLLGCGLISNEDTNTFVWLFKTWLKCMGDKAPHGIITYQDRAMQNAIEIVFPNTKHRWCMWHILKKMPEKFGYRVNKASIFSTVHVLVYDSQSIEEFEEGWRDMIKMYNLHDNVWLSGLYENRVRWVPYFLRTTFWAGMSTIQRSESMNAFFDGYVHAKTSLKQFVEQYERALWNKVEKEFIVDFKSFSQVLPCATTYEIEKQYQSCYTISKFRKVQTEFMGKMYCDLISAVKGHMGTNHAIAVLIQNDFTVVPDRYILRRWRKDVSRAHTRVSVNYDGLVTTPAQMRYDDMCHSFAEVANLVADSEGKYGVIMDWIQLQKKELSSTKFDGNLSTSQCIPSEKIGSAIIRDPKASKRT